MVLLDLSNSHSVAPHVDGCGVFRRAQQHIRRPIPQSHHLIGVSLRRDRLGSCQTSKTRQSGFMVRDLSNNKMASMRLAFHKRVRMSSVFPFGSFVLAQRMKSHNDIISPYVVFS